ncbi:MAG TPA: dual specificity protein phosphatase [Candidatus Thermoplasmatota archaeon]|nr:dual specificity protein phosphatase [Candidatus Thermoplasmatota archaeon]
MRRVTPAVYQGAYADAVNFEGLKAEGITGVLNVAGDANYEIFEKGFEHARVPMRDGPGNPTGTVEAAATVLEMLVRRGHRVLVHCMVGRSRSPAVVLAWLVEFTGRSFAEAEEIVRSRIPEAQIHPAHLMELRG